MINDNIVVLITNERLSCDHGGDLPRFSKCTEARSITETVQEIIMEVNIDGSCPV